MLFAGILPASFLLEGGGPAHTLEKQYFFAHLGDCVVLKPKIFVLLMQFAEDSSLFLVIMNVFVILNSRGCIAVTIVVVLIF